MAQEQRVIRNKVGAFGLARLPQFNGNCKLTHKTMLYEFYPLA